MVPIILTQDGKFNEEGFKKYLLNICKEHKQQNRALAFAFIVYDFEDNAIQQVLEHKKYWTVLDKISGQFLSIFYINSQDSYYKSRQQQIYRDELKQKSASRNSYMQLMRPITLKATPLDKSIAFLKKEFRLDENINHPFVIFFQTDGENLLDYFVVILRQEKLEDAFLELKAQIKNAVDSLSKITPDNTNNHQEIFDLIESGVKSGNFSNFIKTKVISKIGIGTIISFIKLIAGGH